MSRLGYGSGHVVCPLLGDPSLGAVKAAVFAFGHARDKQAALDILGQAIPPLCQVAPSSFDSMLSILFWIRRLGDKSAANTLATLDDLIANAEQCTYPVASRDLLGEARVTAAIVRHKD